MIRTYLEFAVRPGKVEALIALFQRENILQTSVAQPGCQSAELTISADGRSAVVTATWDDHDAYEMWTSRTDRESQGLELSELLEAPVGKETVGKVFDVVATGAL